MLLLNDTTVLSYEEHKISYCNLGSGQSFGVRQPYMRCVYRISLQVAVVTTRHRLICYLAKMPNVSKARKFACSAHHYLPAERQSWNQARRAQPGIISEFEDGLYQTWNIHQWTLLETKHVDFNDTVSIVQLLWKGCLSS